MTSYPKSRPRPAQQEATGSNIQENSRARHATLSKTVDALSNPDSIGAVVFRARVKFCGVRMFAIFSCEPRMAYPLQGACEPGSSRLRLAIERAGFGAVGRSTMVDALSAAEIAYVDCPEFGANDDQKPFLLSEKASRLVSARNTEAP
jgi:hypothetical protein